MVGPGAQGGAGRDQGDPGVTCSAWASFPHLHHWIVTSLGSCHESGVKSGPPFTGTMGRMSSGTHLGPCKRSVELLAVSCCRLPPACGLVGVTCLVGPGL